MADVVRSESRQLPGSPEPMPGTPAWMRDPAELGTAALATLVASARDGIAVVDPRDDTLRYLNVAGLRLLGRPEAELLGARTWLLDGDPSVHPATDRREFDRSTTDVLVADTPLKVVRFRDVSNSRRRERQLKAFSRTAASVAFAGDLGTVLNRLADDVRAATGLYSCTFLLMTEDGELRQAGISGPYPRVQDYAQRLKQSRELGAPLVALEAFRLRRPVVVRGWRQQTLADPRFAPIHEFSEAAEWQSIAVVPLIVRDRILGVLNTFYLAGTEPQEAELEFLSAIADQAAVAVENSRLVGELESTAALEERHRLARELHDSVSQALFSLTLQTRAMEIGLDQDPVDLADLRAGLVEMRELTQGALAEMRALIFQLRPAALREEGLISALGKYAAAVSAKGAVRVVVDSPDLDLPLPENVEEHLFRVAQEAIHNVVKHAAATVATVRIRGGTEISIEIVDDGEGFDTSHGYPGHLGLVSMSERITSIGGTLTVESGAAGTRVLVRVPVTDDPLGRTGKAPS